MARFTSKLMVMGLAGLLMVPGMGYASGGAPDYTTPSPMGSGGILGGIQPNIPLNIANGLNVGNMMNMNLGNSLLQTVANAAIGALTSQLLGQIGGGGMMAGMLQGMAGQSLGQGLGLTMGQSGLFGGGIQGGVLSGGGFGGLFETAANAAVASLVQTGVQQMMGGMQGGGSSGGSSSFNEDDTAGNFGGEDEDSIRDDLVANVTPDPTSDKYGQGMMDAVLKGGPDPSYMVDSENWDSDYMAGYNKALSSGVATAQTL